MIVVGKPVSVAFVVAAGVMTMFVCLPVTVAVVVSVAWM